MGTSQSIPETDPDSNLGASTKMKKDFYELLGVDQIAGPDEIKKAYRKKALELHPDKNANNVEVATQLFSEVQTAYEVLSDPQERAWYDSHREQILREDQDDDFTTAGRQRDVTLTSSEVLKLFSQFSSRMDFRDENPKGFYSIAGKIFETLASEEIQAAARANIDPYSFPSFGNSKSDYEADVKPFYTAWTSFVTMKSFAWEDKYRYTDAPDRRIKRLMEKENKKLRDTAIREFNETVKQFVLFIRKRDPRYMPNFQNEEERNAAARTAARDQSLKARSENAAKLASYKEAEWSKADSTLVGNEFDETSEDEEVIQYECVACRKKFKTEKQIEMHEKSKKHIKAVQTLKNMMRKEGKSLGLDSSDEVDADKDNMAFGDFEGSNNLEITNPTVTESIEWDADRYKEIQEEEGMDSKPDMEEIAASQLSGLKIDKATPESQISPSQIHLTHSENALEEVEENKVKKQSKGPKKPRRRAKDTELPQSENQCAVCKESFDSRTKLFRHIHDEGHETSVPRKRKG